MTLDDTAAEFRKLERGWRRHDSEKRKEPRRTINSGGGKKEMRILRGAGRRTIAQWLDTYDIQKLYINEQIANWWEAEEQAVEKRTDKRGLIQEKKKRGGGGRWKKAGKKMSQMLIRESKEKRRRKPIPKGERGKRISTKSGQRVEGK